MALARASAAAAVQEAEVRAVAAQHELAGLMSLAPGTPPLPADRPHVGTYHTYFAQLFGAGPAPDRTRLIDPALPLRAAAIDAHAVAIQASEDALAAAVEAQAGGQGPLAPVLASLDKHRRQQEQFMASVCRYNHDIADYALTVAGPLTTSEDVVAMLIRSQPPAVQPAGVQTPTAQTPVEKPSRGVVPTSGNEAITPPTPERPPQRTDADPQLQPPTTPWVPSPPPEAKKQPPLVPHSILRHDDRDAPAPVPVPPATRQSNRPIGDAQSAGQGGTVPSPAVYAGAGPGRGCRGANNSRSRSAQTGVCPPERDSR